MLYQGLIVLYDGVPYKSDGNRNQGLSLLKPGFAFDFDFDGYDKSKARILEASFRMSLAEFLVESKIVPVHAYGDLENKITGIQHDSRIVSSGGLFIWIEMMPAFAHSNFLCISLENHFNLQILNDDLLLVFS
ncbi:hypothetical protein RJT34_12012 [Clitoria ternatea]|uniref:Uncharacterized protein n=1 Tax=Clitoria ternatea TaxID=43366 RepID=A0AAN9JMX4_CLITE